MVASGKADKSKPPVFHQIELARGWRILREHVKLRVDLDKRSISGSAKFEFCALNHQFINVTLNLRRCRVSSCRINGIPAPFRFVSPLDDDELLDAVSSDTSRHRVRDIEHSMRLRDDAASAQGELVVDLPVSISADIIDEMNEAVQRANPEANPDEDVDPHAAPTVPLDQLPLLTLSLDYEVLDPTAGAVYYGDQEAANPVLDPVYMLTDSRYGMARFWMPCVDSMQWCDRYLFDFDVAVKSDLMVVASGELIETVLYNSNNDPDVPADEAIKVFKYRLHAPSHASEIVMGVGPFVTCADQTLKTTVSYFCLPGRMSELVRTCPPLFVKALAFCREYFGSDPPTSSFSHLFVESLGSRADTTIAGAGGIVVYSGDLLHTRRCIDEGFAAREAFMSGLVMSYFGRFLRPRQAEDDWLVCGLASHVTALGLQYILGRNWYRFRMLDLMDELKREASVDLSDIKITRATDSTLDSVKRRSHVIVYMIEKRIGSDVLKRALRDIVAEGRSITVSSLKLFDSLLGRATLVANGVQNGHGGANLPVEQPRTLFDLSGNDPEQSGTSGVVSSGFDEALQGVSVGPFLKRLRAICGTELRSLVRLWAASPGVPRMQIGYQYNPRKHCIEFALQQDGIVKGSAHRGGKGLLFTGSLHIRVMEIEGASDHTVEVRDPYVIVELPCHSRRAKHKSASQAEKEFNENPARASPVLWVRVDPDTEWCKDVMFNQSEDSWTALLKGERDAVGQYEACRGLSGFGSEMSAKALLLILEDEQVYWRVRAEAASVIVTYPGGLAMLLSYFRRCYTGDTTSNLGLVRPNNFSKFENYFVKRAMVRAIADARVSDFRGGKLQESAVPVEAAEFLSFMLSTNDNARNEYEDDHYVVDLVKACGKVAVLCLGDPRHANAGEDGDSTAESISKQLERFRSIEELVSRRSGIVSSAITTALCNIEVASLAMQNKAENGSVIDSILKARFSARGVLLHSIGKLSTRECTLDTRLSALTCLANAYSGDLEVALWLLARCDRNSSNEDLLGLYRVRRDQREPLKFGFMEAPTFRYKLLDVLTDAADTDKWGNASSPLLMAARRHTKRAMQLCVRILRLSVGDADPRVRASAMRFAKIAWGGAVPVCLLGRTEYVEAKRFAQAAATIAPVEVVPLKTNGISLIPQVPQTEKSVKLLRPSKGTKASKGNKSSKSGKKKLSLPRSALSVEPISVREGKQAAPIVLDPMGVDAEVDVEVVKDAGSTKSDQRPDVVDVDVKPEFGTIRIPKSVVQVPTAIPSKVVAPSVPRSVPTTVPRSISIPKSVAPNSAASKTPGASKGTGRSSSSKNIPRSVPSFNSKRIPLSVPVIPKSIPRSSQSVPRSAPISSSANVPFEWHPLDREDTGFFQQAALEMKRKAKRRAREDDNAMGGSIEGSEPPANGGEGDVLKKKKKKKRRHLEGDGATKKKKKKKKKHREGVERYQEPNLDFDVVPGNAAPNGASAAAALHNSVDM